MRGSRARAEFSRGSRARRFSYPGAVNPRRAIAWLLLAASLAIAAQLLRWSEAIGDAVLSLALASAAVESVLAAFACALALFAPGPPRERLGLVPARLGPGPTALLALGTLGLSHALDALLALSGFYERSALADFARSIQGARGLPLLAAALCIGLLPAIGEELLCRGFLQRSLLPRTGAAAAIAISALAFGALHLEPVHASFAVLLGVYLGVAGYWSGSVWTPIVCHAVNNLFAIGASAALGPTSRASPANAAAGLLLAAAALFWTARLRPRPALQPVPGSDDG